MKIFIDPGHGGSDAGAVSGSHYEKNYVLTMGIRLRDYLTRNFHCQVKMSRTSDYFLSLTKRAQEANKWGADIFISLHLNAFTGSARGYEDYINSSLSNSSGTARKRNIIHQEVKNRVLSKYGIPNRGMKKARFSVLRNTRMSAILVESLFIDNAADKKLLTNNNVINDFVTAYGEGIAKAIGLKRKTSSAPASTPVSAPTNSGKLYRVQAGAYKDKGNAQYLVQRLQKKSIPAFYYSADGLYRVQCGAFKDYDGAYWRLKTMESRGFSGYIYQD